MNQHFLPKCYLNEFADLKRNLYVLNTRVLDHGKEPIPRINTTSAVCYEKDIYTIDKDLIYFNKTYQTNDPYTLENHFGKLYETKYPQLLSHIKKNGYLSIDDASLFIYSLLSLKFRNKYYRDYNIGKILPETILKFQRDYLDQLNDIEGPYLTENLLKKDAVDLVNKITEESLNSKHLAKDYHLMTFFRTESEADTSVVMKIHYQLMRMKWILFKADTNIPFITTDNPGFCIDPESNIIHNVKFAPPFSFFFPLTPRLCLLITDKHIDDLLERSQKVKVFAYKEIDAEWCKNINSYSLHHLNERIFTYHNEGYDYLIKYYKSINIPNSVK